MVDTWNLGGVQIKRDLVIVYVRDIDSTVKSHKCWNFHKIFYKFWTLTSSPSGENLLHYWPIWSSTHFTRINVYKWNLDRSLLQKILKVLISTPKESFYLELGILPIGTVVKSRRILYLHDLVNLNHTEMLYKFFVTQWNNPTRGDWTELVKEDLKDFGIDEDLVMLQKMFHQNNFKSKSQKICF